MSFVQNSVVNSLANEQKGYDFPRYGSFKECPINPDPVTGANTYARNSNFEWYGGALGVDGNIYCFPYGGRDILGINTKTNKCFTITMNMTANVGWWGGAVSHPNGKIYGIPQFAGSIVEFDPVNKTWSTFGVDLQSDDDKYSGGVLAPNGAIYCIPDDSSVNQVMKIDVYNRTLSYFGNTGFIGLNANSGTGDYGSPKFTNGVLGPDGKIYCIPQFARDISTLDGNGRSTTSTEYIIGVIDPDNDTFDVSSFRFTESSLPGVSDDRNNWVNGTGGNRVNYLFSQGLLGPDGKIYCIPYHYPWICVIDVFQRTISRMNTTPIGTVTGSYPTQKYGVVADYNPNAYEDDSHFSGAKLAPNGKIYAFSDTNLDGYSSSPSFRKVLEIDPATQSHRYINLPTVVDGKTYKIPFYFITTVMSPDGGLYGVPYYRTLGASTVRSDVPSVYYPPSCSKPNEWLLSSNQNGFL